MEEEAVGGDSEEEAALLLAEENDREEEEEETNGEETAVALAENLDAEVVAVEEEGLNWVGGRVVAADEALAADSVPETSEEAGVDDTCTLADDTAHALSPAVADEYSAVEDVVEPAVDEEEQTEEVTELANTDAGVAADVSAAEEREATAEEDAGGDESFTNELAAEDSTCFAALLIPNTSADEEQEEEEDIVTNEEEVLGTPENDGQVAAEVSQTQGEEEEVEAAEDAMSQVQEGEVEEEAVVEMVSKVSGGALGKNAESERRLSVPMTDLLNPEPASSGEGAVEEKVEKTGNKRLSAVADLLNPVAETVVVGAGAGGLEMLVEKTPTTVYDKAVC